MLFAGNFCYGFVMVANCLYRCAHSAYIMGEISLDIPNFLLDVS